MAEQSNREFLTTKQLADRHSCTEITVFRRWKKGIYPAPYKFGRATLFALDEIIEAEQQAKSENASCGSGNALSA